MWQQRIFKELPVDAVEVLQYSCMGWWQISKRKARILWKAIASSFHCWTILATPSNGSKRRIQWISRREDTAWLPGLCHGRQKHPQHHYCLQPATEKRPQRNLCSCNCWLQYAHFDFLLNSVFLLYLSLQAICISVIFKWNAGAQLRSRREEAVGNPHRPNLHAVLR